MLPFTMSKKNYPVEKYLRLYLNSLCFNTTQFLGMLLVKHEEILKSPGTDDSVNQVEPEGDGIRMFSYLCF